MRACVEVAEADRHGFQSMLSDNAGAELMRRLRMSADGVPSGVMNGSCVPCCEIDGGSLGAGQVCSLQLRLHSV